MFRGFQVFKILFCLYISKSLHIHLNYLQNVSPILSPNGLLVVRNNCRLLANVANKET